MQAASLCVTCPNRTSGFCGALLGEEPNNLHPCDKPDWQHYRMARPGEQVAVRDQSSDDVFVICDGWAFRYLQLSNGRRQILNFLLPGDLFSVISVFDEKFHFSVKALTGIRISGFGRRQVRARCLANPDILTTLATSCATVSEGADELVTALGLCSAEERIAYLFLHLTRRIVERSVIRQGRYPFPLRQQHIADAVGLTPVHVSRVLRLFRDRGLVALSEGVLSVLNPIELERIGSLR